MTPAKARRRRSGRVSAENAADSVIAIFKRLAMEPVKVPMNGRQQKVPLAEAIILKNHIAALQGDKNAQTNMWRLVERSGELVDQNDPATAGKPIVVPEKVWNTEELLEQYGVGIVQSRSPRTT
ncbi:hypothetical protein CO669_33455 [Bradyrhizobium sp. Y36]|uniref:hypothetical protein n=1 Tax=Bradyrhizobium sp. Y36 TaxID=2035447 RepID=UPI000BE91E67|nr:hypothetical protein [Bradyrhizobium sp. Y36]PDT83337.1 hypothetical protein CO669_33455 [Bradyrhizobium sp. Y36]